MLEQDKVNHVDVLLGEEQRYRSKLELEIDSFGRGKGKQPKRRGKKENFESKRLNEKVSMSYQTKIRVPLDDGNDADDRYDISNRTFDKHDKEDIYSKQKKNNEIRNINDLNLKS